MGSRLAWSLVGVNVALATLYIARFASPNWATAQVDRPSEYMLVPSEVGGADRGIMYVIDSTGGRMSALSYNESSGRIEIMPATDLTRVFEEGGRGGRRR